MSTFPEDGPGAPSDQPVRLLRADFECDFVVRFLERSLHGLLTHWAGERSERCWGKDCDKCKKHQRQYWKGYIAAQVWRPINKDWYPVVFEATESLDQRLRRQDLTGQLWQIKRAARQGKKPIPVTGERVGQHLVKDLPTAWKVEPVLAVIYGPGKLDLDAANPIPDKIYVPPSKAAPPPGQESDRERDAREKAEAARVIREQGTLGERARARTQTSAAEADKHDPIVAPELRHHLNGIGSKP